MERAPFYTHQHEIIHAFAVELRNRLLTWQNHPSYDTKKELRDLTVEIRGAVRLLAFQSNLGFATATNCELAGINFLEFVDLCRHFNKGGSDRAYREEAARLALLAVPTQKEN